MKVTMKQLAEQFGVSINAVSLALNNKPGVSEDLRRKILKAAAEAGYLTKKDKFVRSFRKNNICVLIPQMYANAVSGKEFYGELLFGVMDEGKKLGYDCVVHIYDESGEGAMPETMEKNMVCGIVAIGKIGGEKLSALEKYRLPLVIADHAPLTGSYNCVLADNKTGGYMAVKYLLDLGFTSVGYFGDLNYSLSIKERFFGYREALRDKLGAGALDRLITACSVTGPVEPLVISKDVPGLVRQLKNSEIPQAYVCSNDPAAMLLSTALREMGYRIPDDVSIIGFDDILPAALFHPPLTTICVDSNKLGRVAARRLKQLIENPALMPEHIVLPVHLVERASVRRPDK